MDTATALLTIAAVWVVTGVVCAFFMARRGHSPFTWWLLGTLFGPLVLALVIDAVMQERSTPRARAAVPVTAPPLGERRGPTVVIGVDGSEHSKAAVARAVSLFDGRIGALILAHVADYEASQGPTLGEPPESVLAQAAKPYAELSPAQIILYGKPAEELAALAERERAHLVVVGSRGSGFSRALLGSVAKHLVEVGSVPVLVIGTDAAAPPRDAAAPVPSSARG